MKEPSALQQYFRRHLLKDDSHPVGTFVTISRQAGAGGHTLANELVRQLEITPQAEGFRGWHIFDLAAYEGLAKDPELQSYLKRLSEEEYHSELTDLIFEVVSKLPSQHLAYKKLFAIMRSLAALGKVILIGRASCCVTANIPGGIRVRLVAPEHVRTERLMKEMNLARDAAVSLLHSRDHERAKLVSDFFNKNINDPVLYDVVWNTHTIPVAEIATFIKRMIYDRAKARNAAAI